MPLSGHKIQLRTNQCSSKSWNNVQRLNQTREGRDAKIYVLMLECFSCLLSFLLNISNAIDGDDKNTNHGHPLFWSVGVCLASLTSVCSKLFTFTFRDADSDRTYNIINKHLHGWYCFQPTATINDTNLASNIIKDIGTCIKTGAIWLAKVR